MHSYRSLIHVCVFILIVAVSFDYMDSPFEPKQMATFSDAVESVAQNKDPLYNKIKHKSEDYEEDPQNAVIDKVWKKMPGRNGVEVNLDESYEQMQDQDGFEDTLLVYDQIEPDVTMDDLPPAPVYRGHSDKDMVSLLINVAWGTEHIPAILNTLKEHDVKATFFIEGKWAKNNTDYVKMIEEQDHLIGNHAYNHPVMSRLSQEDILKQINQTNDILEAITGETPQLLAPPSGDYNNLVVETAASQNMQTILWSVDTVDWKNPSVSVMLNRVDRNIHPGAMLLMHPTASIAEGLDSLLKHIEEDGYRFGTVNTLLSSER
ncbi:polysaccharide deacetylase family protein [Barrientosiimonas marina]|uniref:Polysaccharide deacetylase family protein n=1 Tax=Lentibacillus kimchii TaxID=1542911 RepID=A0ABW2UTI6_9BACI